MNFQGLDSADIAQELFEGELYRTPAVARQTIENETPGIQLPFIGFVKRNRARENAKRAMEEIPREFEEFDHSALTGSTGAATIYIKRRIANELQPAAAQIRSLLKPATDEGTYRALGPGGWHVTIAKTTLDLEGATPDEFAEEIKNRFERKASDLLVPIGGVAIVGSKICGNTRGSHGSSRFIGLTPDHKSGLLENMRTAKLLLNPNADTGGDDWFRVPHISVAKAEPRLFGLPHSEQDRLETNIQEAVSNAAENIRPLTLTSLCVEISDPRN